MLSALTLTLLAALPVVDSRKHLTLPFEAGRTVTVQGPRGTEDVQYDLSGVIAAPGGSVKALHWCWQDGKFWDCQVQLVTRTGQVTTLKNGSVRRLAFTPDGKWLAGAGDNTVRLWNVASPAAAPRTRVIPNRFTDRLEVGRQTLCIGGHFRVNALHTALTWPDLRVVDDRRQAVAREIRTEVTHGNTTTTTLRTERLAPFVPPPCR